ncbi:hypothetical protein [Paenisporosarcina indica]|uniref:hypothetical protein n=1 Tax=Paenisporosarcina indica TaxID=650093 RepID=UPI00094FB76A|nr:hypothetical protein [Paenisporosarcina indica]
MKKDFRVQYPLWQMTFIVLLGFMIFSISGASTEFIHNDDELRFGVEFPPLESILLISSIFLTFLLIVVFSLKLSKHNKQYPTQKVSMWQIRPIEYLEQDEGMTHITRRAAQKVYTFFVWALPFMAVIYMVFEIPRYWMIFGILLLAFIQYLIFYLEVRKHIEEDEE